jgi:uncharacterized membrane protein YhhN
MAIAFPEESTAAASGEIAARDFLYPVELSSKMYPAIKLVTLDRSRRLPRPTFFRPRRKVCANRARIPARLSAKYTCHRMKARPLLFFSAAASLIFLCASLYTSADWTAIPKVASISLLAVLGFCVSDLLGIALTLGAIGDLLLGVSRLGVFGPDQLFLGGLAAFLLGHLVYIVMFAKLLPRNWARHDPLRELGVIAVLATLGLVLATIQHSLGLLLVPVIVYALVLATMATTALLADLGNQLAAIGALCFVASDAMLAMAKFRGPFALSAPLIWVTYYLAQLLICLGVAR